MKKYEVTIDVITGLHIGGNKDSVDIGGIDNSVVKDHEGWPYVPGSSLKGKLRSILEQRYFGGKINPSQYSLEKDGIDKSVLKLTDEQLKNFILIASLFGTPDISGSLIFRDLNIQKDENAVPLDYLESKFENVIDRKTGKVAGAGARETERVVPGTIFEGELILHEQLFNRNVEYLLSKLTELKEKFENLKALDNEKIKSLKASVDDAVEFLKAAIEILNNYDYLGGSGTRGYGRVKVGIKEKGAESKGENQKWSS